MKIAKAILYGVGALSWLHIGYQLFNVLAPIDHLYAFVACYACFAVSFDILICALPDSQKVSA